MSVEFPFDKCPLNDGYEEITVDSRLVSMPDSGPSKIRNRFTASPTNVNESYLFSNSEYLQFQNWYNNDLKQGALAFSKTHPLTDEVKSYRFREPYTASRTQLLWRVDMQLEIMP